MSFRPLRLKVREDILFVIMDRKPGSSFAKTCHCIHLPLLIHHAFVDSALPKRATTKLFEFSEGEGGSERWFSSSEDIYAIPHDAGTTGPMSTTAYPKYRIVLSYPHFSWDIFDVELDLTVPGPLKPFRSVRHYRTRPGPDIQYSIDSLDGDLLVLSTFCTSAPTLFNVRSFSPTFEESDSECWRVGRVEGLDRLLWSWLYVDRAAGYFLASVDVGPGSGEGFHVQPCPFVWWFDWVSSGEDIPAHPQGKEKIVRSGVHSAVSKVFTRLKWRSDVTCWLCLHSAILRPLSSTSDRSHPRLRNQTVNAGASAGWRGWKSWFGPGSTSTELRVISLLRWMLDQAVSRVCARVRLDGGLIGYHRRRTYRRTHREKER